MRVNANDYSYFLHNFNSTWIVWILLYYVRFYIFWGCLWRKEKLRCKVCEKVVRYPSTTSKKVQMCGLCRRLNENGGESISVIIRNRGANHN